MAEILLPTAEKQDIIKKETDKIQTVLSDTQYIKKQFPVSGGTDWAEYSNIRKIEFEKEVKQDVYVTALSVTGGGALLQAVIGGSEYGTRFSGAIRITVDGVVTFHTRSDKGGSYSTGVMMATDNSPTGLEYPYIAPNTITKSFVHLYRPIFFKESLKIEHTLIGIDAPQKCSIKYLLKSKQGV